MKIKGYRIDKVLTERSDITIALATQRSLDRQVFLKILPADLSTHQDILDQFEQEAKALARLDNPHIIAIHEFSRSGKNPFIVLEYFPSHDLGAVLKHTGPVPAAELFSIMNQSLDGLNHAHQAGVLHRDLKPENVLLDDTGRLKLTDFGLSTLTGVNQPGQGVAGTAGYFAPELALGEAPSEATDIFALGMVFYELATGKNPLKSSDLSQALNLAVTHVPTPVTRINAMIPMPLAAVIERMIAQAPDRRYPNCEHILEDLRKVHFPESATTKEPGSTPPSLSVKQRRRFSSLAGVSILGLAVAITLFAFRWTSTVSKQTDKILPPVTATPTAEPVSDQNSAVNLRPVPESIISVPTAKPDSTATRKVDKVPEPKTLPAAPQFSDLTIIVYPWANVYLDSNFLGSTPLDSAIRVNPGQHQIRFRNPRFPDYDSALSVAGPRDTLVFRWTDIFGFVRLTVNPWANVYIDGAFIDATPLDRLLPLKAGDHHVILKNPDFPLWQKFIRLTAGDTVDLKVQLIG